MNVSLSRAVAYDVVVMIVFLMIGNAAHDSAAHGPGHLLALGGVFLAGLAAGWGAARAWRAPARVWPVGAVVWVVTVAVGITLRGLLIPDAGFAPSFIAVAAVFLGVTLLGWRALASVPPRQH